MTGRARSPASSCGTYSVQEIFYTLQGEGANAGRPAVFCRFTGCNPWTGDDVDRPQAVGQFRDTEVVATDGPGGGQFTSAGDLAAAIAQKWPRAASTRARPLLVCTGGEPLLQLDDELVRAVHAQGFELAVETDGTELPPDGIDWICVTPKAHIELVLRRGDELKLVFPQEDAGPEMFESLPFRHFFLQPMDGPQWERNTELAVRYCLEHPQWRISLQTNKILGIP